MNRQFNTSLIICPNCGHVIGEHAYFQTFELKAATWLQAKVAPPATKAYDVFDSAMIPNKTFQVKYAHAYQHQLPNKPYLTVTWTWLVKRPDTTQPDFFVLFGIDDKEGEQCFLYSRADFIAVANEGKKKELMLRVTAKKQSDKADANYLPRLWLHHVPDPSNNLAQAVLNYKDKYSNGIVSYRLAKLLLEIDRIRELQSKGMSQAAIGKLYGVRQKNISQALRTA